jgi:hypothetical protein
MTQPNPPQVGDILNAAAEVFPSRTIDPKGRCCGRKPIPYKRDGYLFCPRCDAAYDIFTGNQRSNWAWLRSGVGFAPRYPESHAVRLAREALSRTQAPSR